MDQAKMEEFLGKAVSEMAAAYAAATAYLGDRLGLYRALADAAAPGSPRPCPRGAAPARPRTPGRPGDRRTARLSTATQN